MSQPKEIHFFADKTLFSRGHDWYLQFFKPAGQATVIGESSTEYTKAPLVNGVPERIFAFNQNARFIYIMRDPVERTISHYWHKVRCEGERRDMLTTIREEPNFCNVSNYAMQLNQYNKLFGKDSIYTLTFEEMRATPLKIMQSIFRWLGVDCSFVPPNLNQQLNETPREIQQVRGVGFLDGFRRSRIWNVLGPNMPHCVRKAGRKMALKNVDRHSKSTNDVVEYLRPLQIEQTERLSEILKRRFPEWTTLWGTTYVFKL